MKKLLLFTFVILYSIPVFSQDSPAKSPVCDNVFNYEISENSNTDFNVIVTKSSNDDFTFKLYSISGEVKLINEITSDDSNQKIEFDGLDKDKIYLIQVYGTKNNCRFTIGGMEGIKYENK
ncbi:MAG: hypothetical protein ACQETL_19330 [Bacteroidota bacterium]